MKKIITFALALSCGAALAQKSENVGIGTTKPDPSALLDLNSTSKGLLLPRMNQAQRDAIKNPAAGLIIFQTDQVVGTYTFDGTTWQPSNARTADVSSIGAWEKQGNAIDGTDFIGSTNNFPLIFKVNGTQSGYIGLAATSNTFLGLAAGRFTTGFENTAIGTYAMNNNIGGQYNVAIGSGALNAQTNVGTYHVGIGRNALANVGSNSENNVGIGSGAGYTLSSGDFNLALGSNALYSNSTGNYNVAIGSQALQNNTSSYNVAIGVNALYNLNNAAATNNFALGANAGLNMTNGSNNVLIGTNVANDPSITNISDKLYIANSGTVMPLVYGDFSAKFVSVGDVPLLKRDAVATAGSYSLLVEKGILCEKLKVALKSSVEWADYVFEPSYKQKMLTLEQVEAYTVEHKHLPNVPSAEEMAENGLDLTQTSSKLLEKIEELTLYMIELNKQVKELKKENEGLKKSLDK